MKGLGDLNARNGKLILFSTLSWNQTAFFVGIADVLRAMGYDVVFLAFRERCVETIKKRGYTAYNIFDQIRNLGREGRSIDQRFDHFIRLFGIDNPNRILSHEKAAYEVAETLSLKEKFADYSEVLTTIFKNLSEAYHNHLILIQELGGFLACVCSFHAARIAGIDNVFLEPSFFRGRVFLIRNSFRAYPVPDDGAQAVSEAVRSYLEETLRAKRIVIPVKDAWQYTALGRKIFRIRNVKRFVEKVADKYIFRKQEEFNHIYAYVNKHVRMLVNQTLLSSRYQSKPNRPFIYYPLHVPADMALTVRSPEYLDQYSLLDYLARNIPTTHRLVFKEHPALIGAVSRQRVKDLLRQYDNLVLLDPKINNFDVINSADLVITVNSKSGAEALLCGKKVIALGDAFYTRCGQVKRVERLDDLPSSIRAALLSSVDVDLEAVFSFFQSVWDHSYPGEIFLDEKNNFDVFASTLHHYLSFELAEEGSRSVEQVL